MAVSRGVKPRRTMGVLAGASSSVPGFQARCLGERVEMESEAGRNDSETLNGPSELRGPLPRRVQMSSTDASFLLVVVVVCLGIGSIAVGFECFNATKQMRQRTALGRDGLITTGKVSATHGGHGDSMVSYTFNANGTKYVGSAEMPNYRLILHESDAITIRFLPSEPTINHPADWDWSGGGNLMPMLFALFFVTMGSVALLVLLRDRKLAREGKPVQAVVIDCNPDKAQFRLLYEFRTTDGLSVKGSCNCAEEYEEGTQVWILYLPKRPRRNHSYPMEYFSVVG
jgi:hypothetical protein